MSNIKDNSKEFDRIVRSVMLDAEEDVSPRIWDAVSGTLVRRRRIVWLRRSSYAVASMAAAVLIAILLHPTQESTNQHILTEHNRIAGNAIPEPVDIQTPTSGEDVRISRAQQVQRTSAVSEDIYVPAEVPGPAGALPVAEESTVGDLAADEASNGQPAMDIPVAAAADPEDYSRDNRALDALASATEKPASRRISLTAGGDIFTNNNPSETFRRINRAPSLSASEPGIRELGGNTFGVPVSAGIGIRYDIDRHWSVGTGVSYSLLSRSFNGIFTFSSAGALSTASGEIENRQHYLGIPVNVYYNIISSRSVRFYASAGGTFERCLSDRYSMNKVTISEKVRGMQVSAAAGLGVEFRVTDFLGMYIDPSMRYYFDCGQPVSIRTQQPLLISLEFGFRFGM